MSLFPCPLPKPTTRVIEKSNLEFKFIVVNFRYGLVMVLCMYIKENMNNKLCHPSDRRPQKVKDYLAFLEEPLQKITELRIVLHTTNFFSITKCISIPEVVKIRIIFHWVRVFEQLVYRVIQNFIC